MLHLKKFSDFLLKVYFKKVTEILNKTAKKVSTVPKTVHFKKVSTLPITEQKKYSGTAHLCSWHTTVEHLPIYRGNLKRNLRLEI